MLAKLKVNDLGGIMHRIESNKALQMMKQTSNTLAWYVTLPATSDNGLIIDEEKGINCLTPIQKAKANLSVPERRDLFILIALQPNGKNLTTDAKRRH